MTLHQLVVIQNGDYPYDIFCRLCCFHGNQDCPASVQSQYCPHLSYWNQNETLLTWESEVSVTLVDGDDDDGVYEKD